jgi:Putative beta-barrel porin-2, OmpL-like. bbp2
MKRIYLTSVAATCLLAGLTGAVQAQVYDEKFEVTDPTFEQRSAEERAMEQGQTAPAAAKPSKPGKKIKGAKKAEAAPPPAAPAKWSDTLTVDGFVEGGIAVNPAQPFNGLNWGHLYTDRANTPTFNSGVLTVQRPLDAKSETFDYGFKLQGMVGEDMRYNHYMGELDYAIPSRTQIGPIEAHALMHFPIKSSITEGGIDVKVGQFVTMNGAELITAKDNLFYSHAYMFNFGPFVDTGVMVTTHSKSWLDIYTGVITGNNMSIGWPGDNNHAVDFHGGFGFNFLDGDLVIMAITTTGPENAKQTDKFGAGWPSGYFANGFTAGGVGSGPNYPQPTSVTGLPYTANMSAWGVPSQCACNVNTAIRSWNNLTTTWKATDRLTFVNDISFMMETGWNPSSFGEPYKNWGILNGNASSPFAQGGYPNGFFGIVPAKAMGATAYGVAQNVSYKYDDVWLLKARLEYFRDANNFFISAYPGYYGNANAQHGYWDPSIINRNISLLPGGWNPAGGPNQQGTAYTGTSYLALTVGTTITPKLPDNIPYLTGLMIRPELRWDQAVNGTSPFFSKNGMSSSQGLFNMDIILPFSLI